MRRHGFARRLLTIHLPVALIVLLAIGPFLWMILTSLTPSARIAAINSMRLLVVSGSPPESSRSFWR